MIRLLLRGFQSHKDTTMELNGGFVCITGPNNAGKSAVIRAVRWLMYDALHGSRFIKKGSPEAQAELQIGNAKIARIKSKSKNQYQINGVAMDSVGIGVPIEVHQAIGIRAVKVDKDQELEVNVQQDAPFLMGLTGTLKAKVLNVLTGSNVIDMASRESVADTRRMAQEQSQLAARKEALLQEQEQYAGLAAKEETVKTLWQLLSQLEALVAKARNMRELRDQLADATTRVSKYSNISDRRDEAAKLLNSFTGVKRRLELAKEYMAACDRVFKRTTASDRRAEVDDFLSQLILSRKKIELTKEQKAVSGKLKELDSDLELYKMQRGRVLEQMRMLIGARCASCGQTISEKCLQEVA